MITAKTKKNPDIGVFLVLSQLIAGVLNAKRQSGCLELIKLIKLIKLIQCVV